jgi:hypothetical protein
MSMHVYELEQRFYSWAYLIPSARPPQPSILKSPSEVESTKSYYMANNFNLVKLWEAT